MIKIIKHGKCQKFTKTCDECGCEFEHTLEDVETDYTMALTTSPVQYERYVKCPECGKPIFHDRVVDKLPDFPFETVLTSNGTWGKSCENCDYYKTLKTNEPVVGDTPCTWCEKNKVTC